MRVILLGAGGVGGYYASKLIGKVDQIKFIARGKHLESIKKNGLKIEGIEGEKIYKVDAGEDADQFGIADLVILAVKHHDTKDALKIVDKNISANTNILIIQNGAENEDQVIKRVGKDKIIRGIAFIGSRISSPGVISHTAFGSLKLGRLDRVVSSEVERLNKIFNDASVNCVISDDIVRDCYYKLLWNVGFNAVAAIARADTKMITANEDLLSVSREAMQEYKRIANAKGIDITDEMIDKNIEITSKGGTVYPSMLHDMLNRRFMEIDIFNGKVVELGRECNIECKVNETLTSIVRFYNDLFLK